MTFSETLPIIWHASCLWELLPAGTAIGKIRSQHKHAKLVDFIWRQEVAQDCRANLAKTLHQNLVGEDTEVHPWRFDGRYEQIGVVRCVLVGQRIDNNPEWRSDEDGGEQGPGGVEMLSYAALSHCRADAHSRALSKGRDCNFRLALDGWLGPAEQLQANDKTCSW